MFNQCLHVVKQTSAFHDCLKLLENGHICEYLGIWSVAFVFLSSQFLSYCFCLLSIVMFFSSLRL